MVVGFLNNTYLIHNTSLIRIRTFSHALTNSCPAETFPNNTLQCWSDPELCCMDELESSRKWENKIGISLLVICQVSHSILRSTTGLFRKITRAHLQVSQLYWLYFISDFLLLDRIDRTLSPYSLLLVTWWQVSSIMLPSKQGTHK